MTSSEAAAADLELIGTLKRGKEKGTLVLRSARVGGVAAGKQQAVALKIPKSLGKLVGSKLSVRVTLTDAAGNRTVTTAPVKVVSPPKKKAKKK